MPLRYLGGLYFVSGTLGLVYEILWSRLISFQFGASILGAALTVAAFMIGLGVGALLADRLSGTSGLDPRRALRFYALLEGMVAVFALLLPALHGLLTPVLDQFAPALPAGAWRSLQSLVTLVELGVPATALGAGFPLVLRSMPLSRDSVGKMYGLNCLGATLGAAIAPVLIMVLGWPGALHACAAAGLALAAGAWLLAAGTTWRDLGAPAPAVTDRGSGAQTPAKYELAVYAGVGACALALEVAWTRLFGLVMMRTEFVLALILATYLAGTGLGSLASGPLLRYSWTRIALPIVAASASLLGLALLPWFGPWLLRIQPPDLTIALAIDGAVLAILLVPVTFCLGAWLPLMADGASGAGLPARAARLYGANAIGAAFGALFVVGAGLPWLGTAGCLDLGAAGLILLGPSLFQGRTSRSYRYLAIPVIALAILGWHRLPPAEALMGEAAPGREIDRYEDALTLNQVTQSADGQRVLLTDLQHMDASSEPSAVEIQRDQLRLPLLLHPHPARALLLGLGTGVSASAATDWPQLAVDAVEISPGAVHAARTWFAAVNRGVTSRLNIVIDDARHHLASSPDSYDVIVGDLFHPDLAGMGSLLSEEQFARARSRLNRDGVFVQWLALNQFDVPALQRVEAAFLAVFPDAVEFLDGMHLALVGAPASTISAFGARMAMPPGMAPAPTSAQLGGEGPMTWLGRYVGPMAPAGVAAETQTQPGLEFQLARLHYAQTPPLAAMLAEFQVRRRTAPEASAQLGVPAAQYPAFLDAHAAQAFALQSWAASVQGNADRARIAAQLAYQADPLDRWMAGAVADAALDHLSESGKLPSREQLLSVVRIYPGCVEAWRALWHLDRSAGSADAALDLAQLRQLIPLDSQIRDAR